GVRKLGVRCEVEQVHRIGAHHGTADRNLGKPEGPARRVREAQIPWSHEDRFVAASDPDVRPAHSQLPRCRGDLAAGGRRRHHPHDEGGEIQPPYDVSPHGASAAEWRRTGISTVTRAVSPPGIPSRRNARPNATIPVPEAFSTTSVEISSWTSTAPPKPPSVRRYMLVSVSRPGCSMTLVV